MCRDIQVEFYIRRDDNYVRRDDTSRYFLTWETLPAHHRCLLSHARGRVLDLGAGSGQHSLALWRHGLEVTTIDSSPQAVAVCADQGLPDARLMDANALTLPDAAYDTVLLLGNTIGLAGTPDGLRALLWRLHTLVRPGGQLLCELTDYRAALGQVHRRYHRENQERERNYGATTLRIEADGRCSRLFAWLLIALDDLRAICTETGWRVARAVQVNDEAVFAVGIERLDD